MRGPGKDRRRGAWACTPRGLLSLTLLSPLPTVWPRDLNPDPGDPEGRGVFFMVPPTPLCDDTCLVSFCPGD